MTSWSNYTLKKQLLILFSSLTATSLGFIGIMFIVYVAVTGTSIQNSLGQGFLQNSQNSIADIITSGAQLFDMRLSQLTCNFPDTMATVAEDSFRIDYPYGNIPSYYNWPGQLINPTYSTVYNANITYVSSTINVYNKTIYDVPNLSSNLHNIINKTAHMDYFFVPTFANSPDFLAGYISTPTQFLRYYPGAVNDKTLNTYINYNNLNDYWYLTTMQNQQNVYPVYTSPYYDPIAKELMITIGRVLHNPYDKTVIGAFGSDLMLRSIQDNIKKLTYLNGSRTILFEKQTGYVIADSSYPITSLITYQNLTSLTITSSLWNSLLATTNTLISDTNNINYYLSVNLTTSNGKYILITVINQQYVANMFSPIMNSIGGIISNEIGIAIGVSIAIIILTIGLTIIITNHIVSPLQQLSDISSKMAGRIGETSLVTGIDTNIGHTGIQELDDMTSNFKNIVTTLDHRSEKNATKTDENIFYGNVPWNGIALPQMPSGSLEPPPYTE